MKTRTVSKLGAILAASALVLSACGASNSGGGSGGSTEAASSGGKDWSQCSPGSESKDVAGTEDSDKNVTLGIFNGWDESYATVYLLKNVLEQDGYTVKTQELDAGPCSRVWPR